MLYYAIMCTEFYSFDSFHSADYDFLAQNHSAFSNGGRI